MTTSSLKISICHYIFDVDLFFIFSLFIGVKRNHELTWICTYVIRALRKCVCEMFHCFVRVVHSGTKNKFTMPVMLAFWGKEENKNAVIESMARCGYKLNTGGSRLTGTNTVSLFPDGMRNMSHAHIWNICPHSSHFWHLMSVSIV